MMVMVMFIAMHDDLVGLLATMMTMTMPLTMTMMTMVTMISNVVDSLTCLLLYKGVFINAAPLPIHLCCAPAHLFIFVHMFP